MTLSAEELERIELSKGVASAIDEVLDNISMLEAMGEDTVTMRKTLNRMIDVETSYLQDICVRAMYEAEEKSDPSILADLAGRLPPGFYRIEIRTAMYKLTDKLKVAA